ncbi:MaoC family dehydratase [bacterium]|nr:MAG: MaoC family dehydratase [bacterium]
MNNQAIPFGRYLEDFKVGDVYVHAVRKTITESDNNLFSLLTMNHHPVHLDLAYAEKEHHGKILVVGTLVFSLIVGLTVADVSGKAIANLDYESIKHTGPVFIGDTVNAVTEVIDVRYSKKDVSKGVVYVETKGFNQQGNEVIRFRRHVLIKSKGN